MIQSINFAYFGNYGCSVAFKSYFNRYVVVAKGSEKCVLINEMIWGVSFWSRQIEEKLKCHFLKKEFV